MSSDTSERLSELLLEWEEARERGQPVDPAALCPDDPAMLRDLTDRVRVLDAMSSVLDLSAYRESRGGTTPETVRTSIQPVRSPPDDTVSPERSPLTHSPRRSDAPPNLRDFEVLEVLGRGGMGVVYRAKDRRTGRIVAIKMILAGRDASPAQRKRFKTEAELVARFNHTNIVQLYQVGEHDGVEFLVMEFADGGSLEYRLRSGPMPARDAAELIATAARAVDHAHSCGVIHRDLKPANILLASTDPGKWNAVKITDFGLARFLEPDPSHTRQTLHGFAVGTPAYMSPEQAQRDDVNIGPGTDIFALGVVLYQCLTGQRPFEGPSDFALMKAIVSSEPKPLSDLRPDVPADLQAICMRCLQKKPADRYNTATELAIDLERFLAGLPTEAKWINRRKWILRAGGIAAGAAGLAGYFAWPRQGPPVTIGVIQPFGSAMATASFAVRDAVMQAVDEWNAKGGVLNRPIVVEEGDSGSSAKSSAAEARRLLRESKAACLIAGASSIELAILQPVVAGLRGLMFFPADSEGMSDSEFVYHMGGVPNNLHLPTFERWRERTGVGRVFLIGVGTLYPRAIGMLVREHLERGSGGWAGQDRADIGSYNFDRVVAQAKFAKADGVVAVIRGNEGLGLFDAMRSMELDVPVLWWGMTEQILGGVMPSSKKRHSLGCTYFESIDCPINRAFVAGYRRRHGRAAIASDAMEGAYTAVHLWAQAAQAAGSVEVEAVRPMLRLQRYLAPGGPVRFAEKVNYPYKYARLGEFNNDGIIDVVWRSEEPIEPKPFPPGRTPDEWRRIHESMRG